MDKDFIYLIKMDKNETVLDKAKVEIMFDYDKHDGL